MDDLQPQMQRQMGRLENGPHPHREGLAAGVALVEAGAGRLALQAADALGFPAMVADGTVGPQPRLHIGESGGFVLEIQNLTFETLEANKATIDNIRLWDWQPLIDTYAQLQAKLPTIGFLGAATLSATSKSVTAFVQRLRELGWIEGRTVAIEYRWGEGRNERFAEIAAEFVRLKVDVIVTSGVSALVVKRATSVIPIVFAVAADRLR